VVFSKFMYVCAWCSLILPESDAPGNAGRVAGHLGTLRKYFQCWALGSLSGPCFQTRGSIY
jgi:hypothetical protein